MSQRLLNEVAAARLCLLKPDRRERYDEVLRARLSLKQPSSAFDVVHERKNPPAAPNQAAKAPPPVPGLAVKAPPPIPNTAAKPPPVPAAVKPPPVLSAPPPAPAAAKPAAAIKTASDSPATAIAIRGPTDLAKPASAGTDTIELIGKSAKKTREIELAPKSSDWDQAIAEACSTQSVVYRRRRRWHISQSLIQFAIGASLLAGLLYGGAVAFRMWQDYDSKRVNEKLIAKKTSPPPPPMSTTTTTTTSAVASDSQSDDSSVNQPERQPTETPNFGARRANGASLPPDQASPRNSTGDAGANNQPSVPVPAGNQTSGRRPVPGLAAQKKAGTEIDDIFKRDYKEAATALSGKAALAKLFVRVARDTNDDPAKHYVLDDRALTMAIEFGDVDLAADVVRDLIANFQVDPWEVRISALNKLVRANGPWLQRTRIAQGALPLVDDAIAEGRFDEALELSELSLRMANNSRDVALREQSRNAVERVKLAQKRLVAFEAATSALAGNPDDPNAHLTVG
ncbi:MAG TPA: hypothetical protein VKB78_14000, partial [Pirellulales bacterium]|nr:hypothetical protein [Pirellulales bacterium]